MSGIQVDPSRTSEYAMASFGENYTKLVMEASQLRAFSESASSRVEELEQEVQQLQRFQVAADEALATINRLRTENEELRRELATHKAD